MLALILHISILINYISRRGRGTDSVEVDQTFLFRGGL